VEGQYVIASTPFSFFFSYEFYDYATEAYEAGVVLAISGLLRVQQPVLDRDALQLQC
jgi:hypothetical protein